MPECAYGKAGAAREGAALFVWRSGGRGLSGVVTMEVPCLRRGRFGVYPDRLSYRGFAGVWWRCPGGGGAFCVQNTGFVRSVEGKPLVESIAAMSGVSFAAEYRPCFRDALGARRRPVLCMTSGTPVPPSGAALMMNCTRLAGHGEPSRQPAREPGVRVAEALPGIWPLSAGQTASRAECRVLWTATCVSE